MANVTTINVPQGDFVTSSLIGAITSASTSFTIGSALSLDANGGFLELDYDSAIAPGTDGGPETVAYTSYNTSTGLVSGVNRAQAGTTAVAHANTATVQCGMSAMYLLNGNLLKLASSTSNFTTASTSAVQITGLTTGSITVPAGGRSIRVRVVIPSLGNTSVTFNEISIWDGTVGSGTQVQAAQAYTSVSTANYSAVAEVVLTPAAGTKTYNAGAKVTAGTITLGATSTSPMQIVAELL